MKTTRYNQYIKYILLSVVVLILLFLIIKISKEYFKDGQYIMKKIKGNSDQLIDEASMQILFADEGMAPKVYDMFSCGKDLGSITNNFVTEQMDTDIRRYFHYNTGNLNLKEWITAYLQVWNRIQRALNNLNKKGLYHNDLWAANIVGDLNDRKQLENIKLIDFGLSQVIKSGASYPDTLRRFNLMVEMYDSKLLYSLITKFTDKIDSHFINSSNEVKHAIINRYNLLIQKINTIVDLRKTYESFLTFNPMHFVDINLLRGELYDKSKKMLSYSVNVSLTVNLLRLFILLVRNVLNTFENDYSKYNKICILFLNFLFSKVGGGLDWNTDGSSEVLNKILREINTYYRPKEPTYYQTSLPISIDTTKAVSTVSTIPISTVSTEVVNNTDVLNPSTNIIISTLSNTKSNCENRVDYEFKYPNKNSKKCNWKEGEKIGSGAYGDVYKVFCNEDKK